jgi:large subunit ribosomal protein L10
VAVIRPEKVEEVEAVRSAWAKATTAVLLDFRGIDVATITELRKRFRAGGVQYLVVKNSLVKQALKGTALDGHKALDKHLKGQTGIAWSFEDPTAAAKIIKAFRKENEVNEKLQVKCGILETTLFEGNKVESELATMPGKNEIRAALLAQLMAPMGQLVRQLAAAGQNLAYVLDARARQQEGQ